MIYCGSCYSCQWLDKSKRTKIIREKNYLPHFNYYCKKRDRMVISIYVSEKRLNCLNWEQESEETQLKQMGCSDWQLFQKEEDITLFDWGII